MLDWKIVYILLIIARTTGLPHLEIIKIHDVRGSVHHSIIHIKIPTRCNSVSTFFISHLYEAQHVSGDTPPIIGSLKLPLVLHTWKVDVYVVAGLWQRPATTWPSTFHVCKTRGCYCIFRLLMMGGVSPETCWASYKYEIQNVDTLLHLVGIFVWIIIQFSGCLLRCMLNSTSGYFRASTKTQINPLNAELNPICYLLALLGAHHFLHVSRIRVKSLTLRLLMPYIYIYGAPILDVSRSHTTTQHSR